MSIEFKKNRIRWLRNHPLWTNDIRLSDGSVVAIGTLESCLSIELHWVNPANETVEDNDELNTESRVWLEAGPMWDMSHESHMNIPNGGWSESNKWVGSHDLDLDCGAPSLEEALLKLADLVEEHYGQGRDKIKFTAPASSYR